MRGELVDQIPQLLGQILAEIVVGVVERHQVGDHHPVALGDLAVRRRRKQGPEEQDERPRCDSPYA